MVISGLYDGFGFRVVLYGGFVVVLYVTCHLLTWRRCVGLVRYRLGVDPAALAVLIGVLHLQAADGIVVEDGEQAGVGVGPIPWCAEARSTP